MSCLLISWAISILLSTSIVIIRQYIRIIPDIILVILVMTPQIIFILILLFTEKECKEYVDIDDNIFSRDTIKDPYEVRIPNRKFSTLKDSVKDSVKDTVKDSVKDIVKIPIKSCEAVYERIIDQSDEEKQGLLEQGLLEQEYHIL